MAGYALKIGSAPEARWGARAALVVVLEDGGNDDGSDEWEQPNELALGDFLSLVESFGAPHAAGDAHLEGDHREQQNEGDPMSAVHGFAS